MVRLSVSSERRPRSDEQLARESQAGSLEAFEELVSRYEHRVYGFLLRSCSNASDAREITQDAFVKAYEALAQYDPSKPFAPWLFTIARRKCIDRYRAALPEETAVVADERDVDDPAELLARKEESDAIWANARRLLTEIQFQALWLRYAEEMNVQQVARVLRKTQNHVKVLLFRARQRLIAELQGSDHARAAASSRPLHESSARDNQSSVHQPSTARAHPSAVVKPWNPAPSIRSL
jgi:RNA polymerase sigma-70 factor (ECF subfamily)